MRDFSKEIRAYALRNALEYGRVDAGRILPKLFQHGLEKSQIKEVMPLIKKIADSVNSLDLKEKEKEFEMLKEFVKEREKKEHELPELDNVGDNMVFRLAPFPSGALHIGNAKTYLLNALYAEKYNAKTLLVMDDTIGSEEKQPIKEAYKLIEQGFKWLNAKYQKPVIYKSDRLKIYYKYAEELIKKGKAYVCYCSQKELRKNREKGKDCRHRNAGIEKQLKNWEEMFKAQEGKAVLRIKTSMQHSNPAFRDRVLFKISERKHPRVGNKYKVWPTLEMSWAIDDHLLGITHILRGNDLMMESEMEKLIWDIFNWKHPVIIHAGLVRIKFEDTKISKSKAQKEVKSGKFTGWDDPRIWSIQSLARRGIKAEAIRQFVKEIGLNKQDITIPIESLYAINRKMIDAETERHYFAEEPVELEILGKPEEIKEAEIPVHPDKQEKRKVKIGKKIFISKKDLDENRGKEVRLLHLFNIKLPNSGNKAVFTSLKLKDIPKMQWVSQGIKTRVLMPSGVWISGLAESEIKKLKSGDVVQFERNFFCRLDKKRKDIYEFWFEHK